MASSIDEYYLVPAGQKGRLRTYIRSLLQTQLLTDPVDLALLDVLLVAPGHGIKKLEMYQEKIKQFQEQQPQHAHADELQPNLNIPDNTNNILGNDDKIAYGSGDTNCISSNDLLSSSHELDQSEIVRICNMLPKRFQKKGQLLLTILQSITRITDTNCIIIVSERLGVHSYRGVLDFLKLSLGPDNAPPFTSTKRNVLALYSGEELRRLRQIFDEYNVPLSIRSDYFTLTEGSYDKKRPRPAKRPMLEFMRDTETDDFNADNDDDAESLPNPAKWKRIY